MTLPPIPSPPADSAPDASPDATANAATAPAATAAAATAPVRERRARTRRSAAMQRAAWMSARARNAARRGVLIATVGAAAVVATLLALVLLPREVDRALRAQVSAIPAARDTMPMIAALDSAKARQQSAEALARAARVTVATSPMGTVTTAGGAADSAAAPRDSAGLELQSRLNRARAAPLVESYRALAEARLLRDDARVRAIVDSLEQVDKEREAYAALGGPDARYATFTARLAALGQRIVRIGEAALAANAPVAAAPPAPAAAAAPVAAGAPPAVVASGTATTPLNDSSAAALQSQASLLATRAVVADSTLVAAAAALGDTVARMERTLVETQRSNAILEERRAAIQSRGALSIPPIAMLLAALIVGLALGYATAIARELRRPTVGDESEVERLAQARVIVHHGAPDALRDARTRRRADRSLPPALEPTAEAWQQLHLTLTGLGDVVRAVRVVADQPALGGALAINLAAAAARESRATLIVEPPTRTPLLALLLRQPKTRGLHDVQQGRVGLREVVTEVPMGRDVAVYVVFAGTVQGSAPPVSNRGEINEELRRIATRYDLSLIVGDPSVEVGVVTHDVIVCARLGVTSLEWLSHVTQQARGGSHRLRAVLLWATDSPTL